MEKYPGKIFLDVIFGIYTVNAPNKEHSTVVSGGYMKKGFVMHKPHETSNLVWSVNLGPFFYHKGAESLHGQNGQSEKRVLPMKKKFKKKKIKEFYIFNSVKFFFWANGQKGKTKKDYTKRFFKTEFDLKEGMKVYIKKAWVKSFGNPKLFDHTPFFWCKLLNFLLGKHGQNHFFTLPMFAHLPIVIISTAYVSMPIVPPCFSLFPRYKPMKSWGIGEKGKSTGKASCGPISHKLR